MEGKASFPLKKFCFLKCSHFKRLQVFYAPAPNVSHGGHSQPCKACIKTEHFLCHKRTTYIREANINHCISMILQNGTSLSLLLAQQFFMKTKKENYWFMLRLLLLMNVVLITVIVLAHSGTTAKVTKEECCSSSNSKKINAEVLNSITVKLM